MAIIHPTKYYCTVSYSQKYYYIIAIYNNTYSAGMKERCRDACRTSLLIAGVVLVPAIFHILPRGLSHSRIAFRKARSPYQWCCLQQALWASCLSWIKELCSPMYTGILQFDIRLESPALPKLGSSTDL